jgi:hypothetical protein
MVRMMMIVDPQLNFAAAFSYGRLHRHHPLLEPAGANVVLQQAKIEWFWLKGVDLRVSISRPGEQGSGIANVCTYVENVPTAK